MKSFKVQVPATIANLGPGFDFMGLALNIMLSLEISEKRAPGNEYSFIIRGKKEDLACSDNALLKAMRRAAENSSKTLPSHSVKVVSDIPLKKGLGSSAAARVGGYIAGKLLCGLEVNYEESALEAAIMERHPDNAYPAALGGLIACAPTDESGRIGYRYLRKEMPDNIRIVLGIPSTEVATDLSREVLPDKVSLSDAVYSSSRALLLFEALSRGNIEGLNVLMDDRMHQPFRQKLIDNYGEVSRAALKAGAGGVAICGSGPSLCAVCMEEDAESAGEAMVDVWRKNGVDSDYLVASCFSDKTIVSF